MENINFHLIVKKKIIKINKFNYINLINYLIYFFNILY